MLNNLLTKPVKAIGILFAIHNLNISTFKIINFCRIFLLIQKTFPSNPPNYKKKHFMKKLIMLSFFVLILLKISSAQSEKFKAIFIYNFAKNIEWPTSLRQGDLMIAIIGNNAIERELKIIAESKRIGTQTIKIVSYNNLSELSICHILYLPPNKSSLLPQAIALNTLKNTLIVTDKDGLALEGAGINFVMNGNKINFEINKKNIENKGLKITNSLLELGILVD